MQLTMTCLVCRMCPRQLLDAVVWAVDSPLESVKWTKDSIEETERPEIGTFIGCDKKLALAQEVDEEVSTSMYQSRCHFLILWLQLTNLLDRASPEQLAQDTGIELL